MAEEKKKGYGYGKRPMWQWIVIYLVIGALVYGVVYYFFLAKKGGYSTPSSGSSSQSAPYNYGK